MFDWIKNKIESIKFIRSPLKIRSYTDVVKERVFTDIDKFRSNVLNMNIEDVENGIKLIGHMQIDFGTHREAFNDFEEIIGKLNLLKSRSFDPENPYGCFNNMYSQSQHKGNPYNPYHTFSKFSYGSQFEKANSQNQHGKCNG